MWVALLARALQEGAWQKLGPQNHSNDRSETAGLQQEICSLLSDGAHRGCDLHEHAHGGGDDLHGHADWQTKRLETASDAEHPDLGVPTGS